MARGTSRASGLFVGRLLVVLILFLLPVTVACSANISWATHTPTPISPSKQSVRELASTPAYNIPTPVTATARGAAWQEPKSQTRTDQPVLPPFYPDWHATCFGPDRPWGLMTLYDVYLVDWFGYGERWWWSHCGSRWPYSQTLYLVRHPRGTPEPTFDQLVKYEESVFSFLRSPMGSAWVGSGDSPTDADAMEWLIQSLHPQGRAMASEYLTEQILLYYRGNPQAQYALIYEILVANFSYTISSSLLDSMLQASYQDLVNYMVLLAGGYHAEYIEYVTCSPQHSLHRFLAQWISEDDWAAVCKAWQQALATP